MILLALSLAVLLGSIPFGLLLTRSAGLGDIRAIGSRSIGATNVLRTGRKGLALATLLLDGGKGAAAVLIARAIAPNVALGPVSEWTPDLGWVCGGLAVLAHCFTPWLRGRGGKGVATAFGMVLAGYWPVFLATGAIWLATAWQGRRSSAAALVAFASAPLLLLLAGQRPGALAMLLVAVLILVTHRGNIARLLAGTEPKIGA